MATYNAGSSGGFDNRDLWINNTGQSTGETFAGQTSSSGSILTGNAQANYSEYTFTANGLTYRYIGEFTAEFSGSLLSGTTSASGTYDRIVVMDGNEVVADYSGKPTAVDFGSEATGLIGNVTGLLDLVGDLLGGEGAEAIENLHLDATPSLPAKAFAGSDRLIGSDGADELFGFNGNDVIVGGGGADTIDGGAGVNTLSYAGSDGKVSVNLATGTASYSDAAGDTFSNIQNLTGSSFNDVLSGDAGANELRGGNGNDRLLGRDGNDRLIGGAGDDIITGGDGVDTLYGQSGADVFDFNNVRESGSAADTRDTIADFSSAQGDKIDLSDLDQNDELSFIGTSKFSGAGGEVRYQVYANATVAFVDLDGDKSADFSVKLAGLGGVTADDFIL